MTVSKTFSFALLLAAALGGQQPQHTPPAHPPAPGAQEAGQQKAAPPQQAPPQQAAPHHAPAPAHPPAAPGVAPAPPQQAAPATPEQAKPAPQTATPPAPQAPAPGGVPPPARAGATGLNLSGATLQEVIDILARQLKINYILDPAVRGTVTINTYGELQMPDLMPLLQTILRMNNATAVQVGNLYHIIPAKNASRLPISPQVDPKTLPEDERMVLNLVPLRYVAASDIAKILSNFLGEGAQMMVLDTGNLLLIQDNSRSMRRTMELLALFDNETLVKQRVKLFEVKNSQASSLVKELESIFGAYALTDKTSAIKFLPIDRISAILVVSPNPNVFDEVKQWVEKLDQPVTVGGIQNFVYKVQYGDAGQLAGTLMTLYGVGGYGGYGGYPGYEGMYGGYGGYGGYPGGGYPGGFQGGVGRGPGARGVGTMGGAMGGFIQVPLATPPPSVPGGVAAPPAGAPSGMQPGAAGAPLGPGAATDRTGTYLGAQAAGVQPAIGIGGSAVRIVPDIINNVIIVQSTQQEWEIIRKTLAQLDIPPRQVLIDAQIYEVTLTDAFSSGVSAFLRQRGASAGPQLETRKLTGSLTDGVLGLSMGHLIGQTRELLTFLQLQSTFGRSRVVSAPSVIATDNLAATINVGTEIPILTSQGLIGGAQAAGTSLFTNTVANRNTGVILNITARVNATGIVTMLINQEVSAALPITGPINSPSIQKRSVQTQVTVEDGGTVAVGGIMQEQNLYGAARLPLLGKIPFLGAAFGSTQISKTKTELIVLLTPHVIYDENDLKDMSEELKDRLRGLQRLMRNQ